MPQVMVRAMPNTVSSRNTCCLRSEVNSKDVLFFLTLRNQCQIARNLKEDQPTASQFNIHSLIDSTFKTFHLDD